MFVGCHMKGTYVILQFSVLSDNVQRKERKKKKT